MNLSRPTFIVLLLLLFSNFIFSQSTISGELRKWHTVTLTFDGPNTSEDNTKNPFLDYRLNVTFMSATGNTFVVPGFYAADGNAAETSANSGNKWQVHFTPNETGKWIYTASFRTGANIAVSTVASEGSTTSFNGTSGDFNIGVNNKSLPDNRFNGRLNYVGDRYLKFEETGSYFLKAGSDSPENLLAYDDFDNTVAKKTWAPHAQDWNTGNPTWKGDKGKELLGAINYLSSKGMNAFSFITMNVIGDGKDVWPWSATNHNSLDGTSGADSENRKRYDVSKLAQWEILFSHAETKGMYLHFKTQETENDQLLDGGDLGIERKLYYRELIARFGHHLVLNWNLGEENDLYQELNDPQNTRVKSYASYIKSIDPYHHHIVIHSYPESSHQDRLFGPLLGNASELTGISTQINIDNIHSDTRKWVLASKNAGKNWVVANDEQGNYRAGVTADADYSGNKGIQDDNRKDTRHKVLWGTLMAGGAGVEYYFGYQTGETDLTAQDFRSRDSKWGDAKIALDFFNDHLPFWQMETHDELTASTSDYCLAKLNNTYAIYLPNGGSTTLDISNAMGDFNVKWFNPSNGSELLEGAVLQITGGGVRSIGTPPNNELSDWVALVTKADGSTEDCSTMLSATTDFTNINVSGYSPAYIDDTRNALAINAATYKDKFAAAETVFNGETKIYDISLNTLCELDGESTYNLIIDGVLAGSFTNPTTNVDYASTRVTFRNISVRNGAVVRLEFNSNTNGKIAEGSGTAYSRGRWTSLVFECPSTTPQPTDDCESYAEEKNGLVVIEAEHLGLTSGWASRTAVSGYTGDGYMEWVGADSFSQPGNGVIATKIKINTPGTYQFQWRSKVGEGTNSTESNDSWLRFADADDFYGKMGTSVIYPRGSGKTPNPEGSSSDGWFKVYLNGTTDWTWTTSTSDNNPHEIYVEFDMPGTYVMEVSGRSKHHLIDRMILSKSLDNATDLSLEETLCTSIDVTDVPVSGIDITSEHLTLEVGATTELTYAISPSNATNINATWSSKDETIATVDQNGLVTALKEGVVEIDVVSEDGGYQSTMNLTVIAVVEPSIAVKGIYGIPQQLTIIAGESNQLTYAISPSNATNTNATWSSNDETIATVDQNGLVTALLVGSVKIEVISEDGGFQSEALINVILPETAIIPVIGIEIFPQSLILEEGESSQLTYVITPLNATNTNATWRSKDETLATVDQNGLVTALKAGVVEIEVLSEDGGYVSYASLTIMAKETQTIAVEGIAVTPQLVTLEEGETKQLSYAIRPLNATNTNATWRSKDETLATVDQNGLVTALRSGVVEVEAISEDGGYVSDAILTIMAKETQTIAVKGIYVTPQLVTLEEGETKQLSYAIRPLNATNTNATWRSKDESMASVDQNGLVTALRTGVVEVEAISEDGGYVSDATFTIIAEGTRIIPVKGIYVTPQLVTLEEGETKQLSYAIRPLNATNTNATWRSKDETMASVDQNGLVTALRIGVVEVEAISEDGGYVSDATFTIIAEGTRIIPVKGIYVTPQLVTLEEGETKQLSYAIRPLNATNTNATWRSKDETMATVDQNGLVTALRAGVVEVEAISEDGGFVSDATFTIIAEETQTIAVKGIYVTPQRFTLKEGATKQISYEITPSNASNTKVTWRSKDETMATVDQNGVVTALKSGIVEVEAITQDGQFKSSAAVTIKEDNNSFDESIVVFPNPTHNEVQINGIPNSSTWISLYSYTGVLLQQVHVVKGENTVLFLAEYPDGVYVIKITNKNKTIVRTIIKK